ncbi:MAG: hypothetical protein AAGE52_36695 [Myxococcota bacterium]
MSVSPPEYVAVWPDDEPSVDITNKTLFTWRPEARELGAGAKATPEDLVALAQTGFLDEIRLLRIDEWAKKLTVIPGLPAVTSSLMSVLIESPKFDGWESLYALEHLEELTIGEKVTQVPDGLGRLKGLKRLAIKGRRIKTLPGDLATLPALTHLTIVNAGIASLPEGLGALPLEELQLSWTRKLKALPESLGECATLRA